MIVQLVCWALCLSHLQAEEPKACEVLTRCQECVRDSLCQWCSEDDFTKIPRCMAVNSTTDCPAHLIQRPIGSVDYVDNSDFSDTILIKPQTVEVILQPSKTQSFNFSFKAPPNHPVDLYFLFDASNTMSKVLQTTAQASENIYKVMMNKTNNVLLGMGTFIDKNASPFLRDKTHPINSFSHKLNMTENFEDFRNLVNQVADNTLPNADGPEGGFDALAQVIICREQFGWRKKSRKFVFFFTDEKCHTAGDGKFAGIVRPYDGKCYTVNGKYTKELQMDYPSPSMISELAAKEGVTIIFIVNHDQENYYRQLEAQISGSKALTYKKNNENIIVFNNTGETLEEVIKKKYEEITNNIEFEVINAPKEIKVTFDPKCTKKPGKYVYTEECTVTQNKPKTISGNITMDRYYGQDDVIMKVRVVGVKGYLTLNVKVVDCKCEKEVNSAYCYGNGSKICGVCECYDNRSGTNCECESEANDPKQNAKCVPPDVPSAMQCSGSGHCECGVCKCWDNREGKFCECVKDNCVDKCNGRGSCYCGKCSCGKLWTGDSCDCHEVPCLMINDKECNNRGSCICGKCKCLPPADWDARLSQDKETCEMKPCDTCNHDQCLKLRDCAICRQSGNENDCFTSCGDITANVVEEIQNVTDDVNAWMCDGVQAGTGCYTRFQYKYDDYNYRVVLLVQTKTDCLENHLTLGFGILIALLVIGILTLVGWKLLNDARDRREYQRFLKLHDPNELVCQNPLYEAPTATFTNPAFRKPSVDHTLR